MIRYPFRAGVLLSFALTVFAAANAHAQSSDAADLSTQLISARRLAENGVRLDGNWRYRLGDNPSWSLPTFDDHDWQTLDPTRPPPEELVKRARALEAQGRPAIIWFRL